MLAEMNSFAWSSVITVDIASNTKLLFCYLQPSVSSLTPSGCQAQSREIPLLVEYVREPAVVEALEVALALVADSNYLVTCPAQRSYYEAPRMDGDLTWPQKMIWDRQHATLNRLIDANIRIEGRASTIAATACGLFGLVSASKIFPAIPEAPQLPILIDGPLFFLVALFAGMVLWKVAAIFHPRPMSTPGTTDLAIIESQYLNRSIDEALRHGLMDVSASIERAKKENDIRADALAAAILFMRIEIACLAAHVIAHLLMRAYG